MSSRDSGIYKLYLEGDRATILMNNSEGFFPEVAGKILVNYLESLGLKSNFKTIKGDDGYEHTTVYVNYRGKQQQQQTQKACSRFNQEYSVADSWDDLEIALGLREQEPVQPVAKPAAAAAPPATPVSASKPFAQAAKPASASASASAPKSETDLERLRNCKLQIETLEDSIRAREEVLASDNARLKGLRNELEVATAQVKAKEITREIASLDLDADELLAILAAAKARKSAAAAASASAPAPAPPAKPEPQPEPQQPVDDWATAQ